MTVKQLMHDFFTNNIDFTSKQFQLLVDFLYGEENNNATQPTGTPFYMSNTYIIGGYMYLSNSASGSQREWYDWYLVNMRIDSNGLTMSSIDYDPNSFPPAYQVGNTFSAEVFNNLNFNVPFADYVNDTRLIRFNGDQIFYNDLACFDSVVPIGQTDLTVYNIDNPNPSATATITGYPPFKNGTTVQLFYPYIPYLNSHNIQYVNSNFGSQIVFTPNMSTNDVNNIINNYNIDGPEWNIITETNYNGDTIYNYYNSSTGDIIINGGSFTNNNGVLVTGNNFALPLTYVNLESIFDKLIDDINVDFGFDGSDGLEPLYFPSYEEVKYQDYSDFYIEPLHQYDGLPDAPTFLGELQLEEYPKYIGSAAQSLLDLLPGVGLSALCCMCFIIGLITSKIRG